MSASKRDYETLIERDERMKEAAPEMYEALKQLIAMMDDCMSDLGYNPYAEDYVPGVTDVELNPRGTYLLSQARAVIDKIEAA